MKVIIVNCFDTCEDRIDLVHDYFISKNCDVKVIQSDFRHLKKVRRTNKKKDFIFIETKPYYKNMSVTRLVSHYNYAKKAFMLVDEIKPDLLYVIVPPNSLAKFAAKYKKKNRNVKLIFDIIDLWPESIPVKKIKKLPPFILWKIMRDKNLIYADFVITECNLFQRVLRKVLDKIKSETVYLAKQKVDISSYPKFSKEEIHLCYLGSINNIIDIPKIKRLIKLINEVKPVTLHIIGDGENKDNFINEIKSTKANVEYHGKIYDPQKKQEIFDKCQFGLNIMKETVCVGLTMKSIDYFQAGLPIINSIKADTAEIVDKYMIGINVVDENITDAVDKVLKVNEEEYFKFRQNVKKAFDDMFSYQVFYKKFEKIFENVY